MIGFIFIMHSDRRIQMFDVIYLIYMHCNPSAFRSEGQRCNCAAKLHVRNRVHGLHVAYGAVLRFSPARLVLHKVSFGTQALWFPHNLTTGKQQMI